VGREGVAHKLEFGFLKPGERGFQFQKKTSTWCSASDLIDKGSDARVTLVVNFAFAYSIGLFMGPVRVPGANRVFVVVVVARIGTLGGQGCGIHNGSVVISFVYWKIKLG
jgi:hypothetical protein